MARDVVSNLTQGAYEALRGDLLSCRIRPGKKLKIQELCDRYSVSLGAVREALARLGSEGLVSAEPQRGYRAASISVAELRDVTMARIEIERLCLGRAIEYGDVEWETRLVGAYHRLTRTPFRSAEDPMRGADTWAEVHSEFHHALLSGADSPWLLRMQDQLYAQSERYRRLSIPLDRTGRDIEQEHEAIMQAALDRDARRAQDLLAHHLTLTADILAQWEEMAAAFAGVQD